MDNTAKLIMLKVLVGIAADDTSVNSDLTVYLSIAESKVLRRAYPYDSTVTVVPAQYETLQCEIAAYLWNKRGAEGQLSHNENGINRSYESSDVPESMLNHIVPHVGVV